MPQTRCLKRVLIKDDKVLTFRLWGTESLNVNSLPGRYR